MADSRNRQFYSDCFFLRSQTRLSKEELYDACYDRCLKVYLFWAEMVSEWRCFLDPKPSETGHLISCTFLVVYLGHGIFHLRWQFYLSPNQFLGDVFSS